MNAYPKEKSWNPIFTLPGVTSTAIILYTFNIFRPYPSILDGWAKVFWFDIMAVLVIIIVATLYCPFSKLKWKKAHILFSSLSITILITSSLNADNLGDLSHLARIIYIIIFSLFILAPWAQSEARFHERISKLIVWTIVPMSILFTLQMFPVGGISEIIYQIYGDSKLRTFNSFSPRVYGSFYNANWAGVYLMVCWISLISLSAYKLIPFKYFSLLILILIFMTIGTGSRTAIVGILISLLWFVIIWTVFYTHTRKLIVLIRLGVILFSLPLLVVSFVDDLVFFDRFQEIVTANDVSDVNSLSARIVAWEAGMAHFMESPLFGPSVHGIPHNSYITWLQAFGISGFTILVALLFALFFRWHIIGKTFPVLYSSSVLVGYLAMAMTAEFFFVTQILLLIAPIVFGMFFIPSPGNGAHKVPHCQDSHPSSDFD